MGLNERIVTCLIIDKDAGIGTSEISFDERSIFLLSSGIPKLQFVFGVIELASFSHEVDSNGGLSMSIFTWTFYSNLLRANLLITLDFPTPLSPKRTIFIFWHFPYDSFFSFFSIYNLKWNVLNILDELIDQHRYMIGRKWMFCCSWRDWEFILLFIK